MLNILELIVIYVYNIVINEKSYNVMSSHNNTIKSYLKFIKNKMFIEILNVPRCILIVDLT